MMDYFWYTYVFVIGSIIGSFLNVCIYRIPKRESIVTGRSHCTACGHTLSFLDMIPILSYLFLRGKCRHCHAPVSVRYPVTELSCACLFLLTVLQFGYTPYSLLLCTFICILLTAAGIDFHTMLIPDGVHLFLLALSVLHCILEPYLLLSSIIGLFIVSIPMLLAALLMGGFGGGDIKLCAACGFFLGWKLTLLGFFLACIAAALYGVCLILLKKATKKTSICFGPFLALGFITAALFGSRLMTAYAQFFL